MKRTIDLKSALLGLGLGVIATLAIGAVSPSSHVVGRFQIGGTGNQGLVIDTMTGQVWSYYFSSAGGSASANFFEPKVVEKR